MDDPWISPTARKHGVHDMDMLHVYRHPVRVFVDDDLVMLVGADRAGRLLEVGVVEGADGDVIVHAMSARSRFLEG